MSTYQFKGSPVFLASAAERLGSPEAASAARRDLTLAAVANLCAQAAEADLTHVAEILGRATGLRDGLQAAMMAADLMLDDVRRGRGLPPAASAGGGIGLTAPGPGDDQIRPASRAARSSRKS